MTADQDLELEELDADNNINKDASENDTLAVDSTELPDIGDLPRGAGGAGCQACQGGDLACGAGFADLGPLTMHGCEFFAERARGTYLAPTILCLVRSPSCGLPHMIRAAAARCAAYN